MKKFLATSLAVLMVSPAFATDEVAGNPNASLPYGIQLGVGVSATSGVNGFIGYANKKFDSFWAKRFGIRFDFGTTSPIKSSIRSLTDSVIGDEGIDIGDEITIKDIDIKAKHMAAMVDFYPFGNTWFLGGWRLSGGYYKGDLKIDANLTGSVDDLPDSEFTFELGDMMYKYTGNTMDGRAWAKWNYSGPYVGTGFDLGLFWGIKIYMDAGVVFTNKAAQIGLDVVTDNLQQFNGTSWETVNIDQLEQAKADAIEDAQSELDDIKFYPMVKMGFMYRF